MHKKHPGNNQLNDILCMILADGTKDNPILEEFLEDPNYSSAVKNEHKSTGSLKIVHAPEYKKTILGKLPTRSSSCEKENILLTAVRDGITIQHGEIVLSIGNGPWLGTVKLYYQGHIGWLWTTELRDINTI